LWMFLCDCCDCWILLWLLDVVVLVVDVIVGVIFVVGIVVVVSVVVVCCVYRLGWARHAN
jgi:hypothetical protein